MDHVALTLIIQGQDDVDEFLWYSIVLQQFPHDFSIKAIKGLHKINEAQVQGRVPFH